MGNRNVSKALYSVLYWIQLTDWRTRWHNDEREQSSRRGKGLKLETSFLPDVVLDDQWIGHNPINIFSSFPWLSFLSFSLTNCFFQFENCKHFVTNTSVLFSVSMHHSHQTTLITKWRTLFSCNRILPRRCFGRIRRWDRRWRWRRSKQETSKETRHLPQSSHQHHESLVVPTPHPSLSIRGSEEATCSGHRPHHPPGQQLVSRLF